MIATKNLHKTYGTKANVFEALRGIDLEIKDGESLAIIGKSGSGKSTLMHLLAGLDRPTHGDITVNDASLKNMREVTLARLRNRTYGFIFQQFFLQPNLSVLENVVLPLKIRGMSKSTREKHAREILKAVGLEDKAKNRATDLSGGQKQRVAIARALVTNPEVVFADEPTGNLDSETGEKVIELLFRLQEERGLTLIIVTHDVDLAKRCKRTIFIKDGQIVPAPKGN